MTLRATPRSEMTTTTVVVVRCIERDEGGFLVGEGLSIDRLVGGDRFLIL